MRAVLLMILVFGYAPVADAFCRATTCQGALCQIDGDGCLTGGLPLFWKTGCIAYSVDARLSQNLPEQETREAIDRAFASWSEVDCGSGSFASITFSPQLVAEGPKLNVVLFQDDDWVYEGTDNSLAKTTLNFDPETGEILSATIQVNTSANKITVATSDALYDLQSILAHEVGHLIGLAHSREPDATMMASYEPGSIVLRSLAPDDLAAACAVYQPGRVARCETAPQQSGCSAASPPLGWVALLLGLRKRRRSQ